MSTSSEENLQILLRIAVWEQSPDRPDWSGVFLHVRTGVSSDDTESASTGLIVSVSV